MRRILTLLACVPLFAQNRPAEFNFVVLDAKGSPVANLKKEDLSLSVDGEEQEVLGLRFEGDAESVRTAPLPPGLFTNRSLHLPGPEKNVVAVVIDSPQADSPDARERAELYLSVLAPLARVALYQSGEQVRVIRDFGETVDRETVPTRGSNTVAALETIANRLAAFRGRKIIVWLGAGAPNGIAENLATAGIAVYSENGRQELTTITGGRPLRSREPALSAKEVAADMAGAYTVAIRPALVEGWHKLTIQVHRKGMQVVAQQGYRSVDLPSESSDWPDADMLAAAGNPVISTALGIDAQCEQATDNGVTTLTAKLQVPDADLSLRQGRGELDFVVIQRGAAGRGDTVRNLRANIRLPDGPKASEAIQYVGNWKLEPGVSEVRVLARDRLSGHYGSLDIPLRKVPIAGDEPPSNEPEPPPPGSDPFIEKARAAALALTGSLPNYVVKQNTDREVQSTGITWKIQDRITAELVYVQGRETLRDVRLNGAPVSDPKLELTGAWSTGQFGASLKGIFALESAAVFHERKPGKVNGREARVYDFSVRRNHSMWALSVPEKLYITAYEGTVWLDPQTARTLKFQIRARNVPQAFPLDQAESSTEYGMVRIGEKEYLLPTASSALVCNRPPAVPTGRRMGGSSRSCSRNVIQFRDYKQFGTESNISFDH